MGHIKHLGPITPYAKISQSLNFVLEDLLLLHYLKQKRASYTLEVSEASMAF